jgi:hypothetical protein
MAKKAAYFAEAERLYVQDQCAPAEIASRLRLGEKTVRDWKIEGKWDEKRKAYILSRQSFHEELYEFARELMHSVREDIKLGQKVDAGRMYTMAKMLPMIMKVKDYEDVKQQKEKEGAPKEGITEDVVKMIEREVLGIE